MISAARRLREWRRPVLWLLVALIGSAAWAVSPVVPRVASKDAGDVPLQFRIVEGRVLNAFYQHGPVAAHVLLSSGSKPRVLVAFPAGNSGVGVWFEDSPKPVQWTLGKVRGLTRPDAQGRTLHGVVVEASVTASHLVVRDAVLSSVRVLRDYQLAGHYPSDVAAAAQVSSHLVAWARPRLDGTAGYAISIELENGTVSGGSGAPLVLMPLRAREPLRLRITALTGETPLTPLGADHLLNANAGGDLRSRQVLAFLSYQEKYLAGSWRFNTYFGRDTLMSLRLLMPALTPAACEVGLSAVLERLNALGEVAHEEDLGEFALLRRKKEGTAPSAAPIYDYAMIDGAFMLAPVAAAYLLDRNEGRAHANAFLARKTVDGETMGAKLARNFAFVVRSARPFAQTPVARNLIALKSGRAAGQWRDSEHGLAGGRYPYDVNAVFVPAALAAIAHFDREGLLAAYATPRQRRELAQAAAMAPVWAGEAPSLFRVALPSLAARQAVTAYSQSQGIDPAPALASLPREGMSFNAIALDMQGHRVPVLHSDGSFALLLQEPAPEIVDGLVETMLRPFPAGLLTDAGLLVANPAYADARVQVQLGRNAYHGTVVWSWQQALLAAGVQHQLQRQDLPEATRAHLRKANLRLWSVIRATQAMRTSELWSWSYAHGRYRTQAFGQGNADADESNAAQLWSTVYLAIPAPALPLPLPLPGSKSSGSN